MHIAHVHAPIPLTVTASLAAGGAATHFLWPGTSAIVALAAILIIGAVLIELRILTMDEPRLSASPIAARLLTSPQLLKTCTAILACIIVASFSYAFMAAPAGFKPLPAFLIAIVQIDAGAYFEGLKRRAKRATAHPSQPIG